MLENETLVAVLQYTKCKELPEPLKEGDIYVRAIAKVKKANNHETMCVIVNNGEGKPIIKKDFGSISMIKEIVEIYPLSVLENESIPDFRKKKDIVAFLVKLGENESHVEQLAASKADEDKAALKALVYKHCIKLQMQREKLTSVNPAAYNDSNDDAESSGTEENAEVNNSKVTNNGTDENNTDSEESSGENKSTDSDY